MKKLVQSFLSLLAGVLSLVFGVAITACDTMVMYYMAPAYIAPVYYHIIQGKVMDSSTSNAIQNIRVILLSSSYTNTATSQSDGSFVVTNDSYCAVSTNHLSANNADGSENSEYHPSETKTIIINSDQVFSTNVDIYIEKK